MKYGRISKSATCVVEALKDSEMVHLWYKFHAFDHNLSLVIMVLGLKSNLVPILQRWNRDH